MSSEKSVAVLEPSVPAIPQPLSLVQKIIESGLTQEGVEAARGLMDLYERMEAKNAARSFAEAMHALQTEMPTIVAQSIIPNRGKYEKFEDVMNVVGPLLKKHGFTVKFSNDYNENRVTETCKITHIGGHSESNSFTVRVGGKADSETQADCKAATTAKRNALLNALNIVIRQDVLQSDDNVSNEGEYINAKEAIELREWVEATGSDKEKFLAFAGAESFETIYASRLPKLHERLKAKEGRK